MKCHQRLIRERESRCNPRPVLQSLDGCEVRQIDRAQAASIILTYEWLGTMPKIGLAYYGLFCGDELHGVACFGKGMGTNSAMLCGESNAAKAVCLERGACVHWAHPHAGSFLVARACAMAARDYGWRVFYAYSDEEAGEIGTIYQACNWLYIGKAAGRGTATRREYTSPDGERYTSRRMRSLLSRRGLVGTVRDNWDAFEASGWKRRNAAEKGRYVHFEGDRRERRALRTALRYPVQPYPKREQ